MRQEKRPDLPPREPPSDDPGAGAARAPLKLAVVEPGGGVPPRLPLWRRPTVWVVLAVLIAAAVGGFLYWQAAQRWVSTDNAYVDAHIVRVAPQVAGVLQTVTVEDGQRVAPGQLLAVIEPSGPRAAYANALGQLAEAEGRLAAAEAQREQARAAVAAATAGRAQSAANTGVPGAAVERARRDLDRYLTLQREQPAAVAAAQVDAARAELAQAEAQLAAARAQVTGAGADIAVARRQLGAAEAQVRAGQANVRAQRARVEQSEVTLGQLRLTAPVAGTVANRGVNLGSYVSPGTQLMAIVPDQMWVTANFKETQLARLRVGQPAEIRVDALPGVVFRGRVQSFQRGAGQAFALLPPQNATGNWVKVVQRVPVRIAFESVDLRRFPLGPGLSAEPRVRVAE